MNRNKPLHQRLFLYISWLGAGLMALGGFLQVIGIAVDMITPTITYMGTAFALGGLVTLHLYLTKYGLSWTFENNPIRIRRLNKQMVAPFFGMIILLWIPRLLPSPEPKPIPVEIAGQVGVSGEVEVFGQVDVGGPVIVLTPTPDPEVAVPFVAPVRLDIGFPAHITYNNSGCDVKTIVPEEVDLTNLDAGLLHVWFDNHQFINQTFVEIMITSLSEKEWVRVSNTIYARVVSHTPQYGPLRVGLPHCGGIGTSIKVPPVQIESTERLTVFSQTLPDVEFLVLESGEFEVISTELVAAKPGLYEVELGIKYIFAGETHEAWSSETVFVHVPQEYDSWWIGVTSASKSNSNPSLFREGGRYTTDEEEERYLAWVEANKKVAISENNVEQVATGNGLIAFIGMDGNLWIVSSDGSDPRALTGDGSYRLPQWSLAGDSIAVVRAVTSETDFLAGDEIWIIPLDGGEMRRIYSFTALPGNYPLGITNFTWLPSQNRIILATVSDRTGQYSWHQIDTDSETIVDSGVCSNCIPLDSGNALDSSSFLGQIVRLHTSREGQFVGTIIASSSDFSASDDVSDQIILVSTDLAEFTIIETVCAEEERRNPTWSPDGRRVAYVCAPTSLRIRNMTDDLEQEFDLHYYLSPGGQILQPVTLSWSFDSSLLAVGFQTPLLSVYQAEEGGVFIVDVENGSLRFLTDGFWPAWQP